MTESLQRWLFENKMSVSELESINGSDIIHVDGLGKMLYLKPTDGKIIDGDFSFIVNDDEFDLLDEKKVDYILFEFGKRFYYSSIKQDKSKYNEVIFKPEFNDFKYIGTSTEEDVMPFAHLGVHSEYEILNGSGDCELWVKKAKFLRHTILGICDKNNLAGSLCFQTACEKAGIKPIIGMTATVAVNYTPEVEIPETFELKLYVMNYQGWKNLLLVSKAINVTYDGFIPAEELYTIGEGLCCVIPRESYFNYIIDERNEAVKLLAKYKRVFDEVYYQIDTVEYASQKVFKEHLHQLDTYICDYKKLVKPILINDSYYLDAEEVELKSALNKISGKAESEGLNQYYKSFDDTMKAYEEFMDVEPLYATILKGIENAYNFGSKVDFKIPAGNRKLPKFDTADSDALFFEQIEIGIKERLKGFSKKKMNLYMERLSTECSVIVPAGLSDYFLILWDIMRWCRENNINTGPGRGSVCGSLVAYLLYITDVDPIKYGLLFERFLNETRVSGERAKSADSMPDIDCDFPTIHRDAVKNYIQQKYGYDYFCNIATYTTMKPKTCIKDFGKIKGIPFDTTNKVTKEIDDQIEYTWGDLFRYACESKTLYKFVQENPEIIMLTKYGMMQPKAESIHPSAVVIVPRHKVDGTNGDIDIWEWMPTKQIDGMVVSQWEGKYIDKGGFLKEDILGLSQLDKFTNIIKLIHDDEGINIDVNKIPLDDDNVFKFFRKGWCEDVFQFGTTGLMNYCKQVKPECLDDLIAMTALFRPGPMDIGAHQDFADMKRGKKKPKYDFGMEDITEATMGLYVYQEQIMKAVIVGGLTPVESDVLRTTIKKKDIKTLSSFGDKFKQGYIKLLTENGIKEPEKYADSVWSKLLSFSGYGFNKSHAAAYSLISYWSQWFKVNYPLEFWTTALQFSKESEVPYRLAEMKKIGLPIEIRPPDINFSDEYVTCDPKERRIFFSLRNIKRCGEVAVKNILETRRNGGKFFSLEEFCSRVPSKVNKTVVKSLIIAGAFDLIEGIECPRDRKQLLKRYLESKGDVLPAEYQGMATNSNSFWIIEQKLLTGFGDIDYENMLRDAIPNKKLAEMYIDDVEFGKAKEGRKATIAGKLIYYQERKIKNGTMCSLHVECNSTILNVTLWPDAYERIDDVEKLKGYTVAVSGVIKKDKFRNQNALFSDDFTKLYIISDYKEKITKMEERKK